MHDTNKMNAINDIQMTWRLTFSASMPDKTRSMSLKKKKKSIENNESMSTAKLNVLTLRRRNS